MRRNIRCDDRAVSRLFLLALVQHTQNHESQAIELKLDEFLASVEPASDAMMRIEEASEEDVERLQGHFGERSNAARDPRLMQVGSPTCRDRQSSCGSSSDRACVVQRNRNFSSSPQRKRSLYMSREHVLGTAGGAGSVRRKRTMTPCTGQTYSYQSTAT